MKKILLSALVAILTIGGINAQNYPNRGQNQNYSITIRTKEKVQKEKKTHENFENSIGFSAAFGDDERSFVAEWVGSHRFSNHFAIGGGVNVGLGIVEEEYKGHYYYYHEYECFLFRAFVQPKVYLTNTRCQPFIDASIGFSSFDFDYIGLYFNPDFGVSYRVKQDKQAKVFLSIGYAIETAWDSLDLVQIKLGVCF